MALTTSEMYSLLAASLPKPARYNGFNTVGNGLASEQALVDLTGQTAAKATTTLFTPTVTGLFRISIVLQLTTAASASSSLGGTTGVTIAYNDGDGNVAQSSSILLMTQAAIWANRDTSNTTTANLKGNTVIYAKAGVAITYAIDYTSVGTAMQYAAHLLLEAL